jgi:hypothetical protein
MITIKKRCQLVVLCTLIFGINLLVGAPRRGNAAPSKDTSKQSTTQNKPSTQANIQHATSQNLYQQQWQPPVMHNTTPSAPPAVFIPNDLTKKVIIAAMNKVKNLWEAYNTIISPLLNKHMSLDNQQIITKLQGPINDAHGLISKVDADIIREKNRNENDKTVYKPLLEDFEGIINVNSPILNQRTLVYFELETIFNNLATMVPNSKVLWPELDSQIPTAATPTTEIKTPGIKSSTSKETILSKRPLTTYERTSRGAGKIIGGIAGAYQSTRKWAWANRSEIAAAKKNNRRREELSNVNVENMQEYATKRLKHLNLKFEQIGLSKEEEEEILRLAEINETYELKKNGLKLNSDQQLKLTALLKKQVQAMEEEKKELEKTAYMDRAIERGWFGTIAGLGSLAALGTLGYYKPEYIQYAAQYGAQPVLAGVGTGLGLGGLSYYLGGDDEQNNNNEQDIIEK